MQELLQVMMNLREKVLKGGAYLAVRQGVGLILGLGGTLLLTRVIGPGNYGLFSSAFGIAGYLGSLTGLGVNVYIVRREAEPGIGVYHQAFTLMFITGVSGLLLGVAALPLLQMWLQSPAFIPPLLIMLLTLPFMAMASPTGTGSELPVCCYLRTHGATHLLWDCPCFGL